jgi:hypothetical protein
MQAGRNDEVLPPNLEAYSSNSGQEIGKKFIDSFIHVL